MGSLFNWFIALFAGFWLFLAARGMVREFKRADRFKWIVAVMYFLILTGAGGFFAAFLSASGVLKLPSYREWPAGYVRGVVTAADGKYIVPLIPSGRVQLYDPQWHFIRGWNLDAGGGDFKVECSPDGLIDVFTARGERHTLLPRTATWSPRGLCQKLLLRSHRVIQSWSRLHRCCGFFPVHFFRGAWR